MTKPYQAFDDANQSFIEVPFVDQGGSGNANKPVMTNAEGFIDPTMLASAEVKTGTAFEAITAKQLVYFRSDGQVAKSSAAVGGHKAQGWAANSASVGQPVTVYQEGTIGDLSGLTPEATVFLSATTAGGFTQTAPTGTGVLLQVVGVALSATELNFTNSGITLKRA
jgi:hypothetical protein